MIPGKGVPIEHFAASGQATVTSITDAHCVRAELVQGTAQWADHTRPMP
ncbi:hypothetical protein ALSL_0517 [Aerosticca soli]|uniref:Uncharacterized protein n=1 Tax=Aerosticca soli TaxID=2010829 RepID=A0A2Z6E2K7_9GAMM|nr:hypothetical protein ALSL_0517 [Aerosticca soli]